MIRQECCWVEIVFLVRCLYSLLLPGGILSVYSGSAAKAVNFWVVRSLNRDGTPSLLIEGLLHTWDLQTLINKYIFIYIAYVLSIVLTYKSHNIIIKLGIITHTWEPEIANVNTLSEAHTPVEWQLGWGPSFWPQTIPYVPFFLERESGLWDSAWFEACCGNSSLVVWPRDCAPWEGLCSPPHPPFLELSLCPLSKGGVNVSGQVFALAKTQDSAGWTRVLQPGASGLSHCAGPGEALGWHLPAVGKTSERAA